jgi:DNA-directed RNA polymerase specialized sigma24 family protein
VRDPAHFGAFVRGVCENVAREHIRGTASTASWPDGFEPPDRVVAIDELVADKELKELLRTELRRLTHEEEKLITEYFQEKDRPGLARDRGITISGLNVKLHRALQHLIGEFRKNQI